MIKNKIKLIFSIFFFSLLYFDAFSDVIKIDGLKKLTLNDIQSLTSIDINSTQLSESDLNKIISELYESELINDISYNYYNGVYQVSINESSIIENIYINGNVVIKDDVIINNLFSKSGSLYNKNNILNDLNQIKNIYRSIGYDNTFVDIKIEKYFEKINLIFIINEQNISRLNDINFVGNSFFSDSFLNSKILSKSHNFYNIFTKGSNLDSSLFRSDKERIIKLYNSKGFFDSRVSYELINNDYSSYIINFFIDEGERSKINKIDYLFENDLQNILFEEEIELFKKKISKNDNFYDLDLISDHLDSFNDILVSINDLNRAFSYNYFNDGKNNVLEIIESKNSPFIIKDIQIIGNSITKDKIIRSKLSFQPGDYLNNYKIDKSRSDLAKLKYINSVNIKKKFNEENVDLVVSINENTKTGNFLFGGSFSGDTGFGLGLGLKDANILGTGNELDFSIDLNSEKSLFKINYSLYSLLNSNLIHKYSIFNQETDLSSSFGFKSKSQGIGYNISYRISKNIDISTGLNLESKRGYSPKNNNNYISDNIDTFNQVLFNFSLNQNNTNDILYPTKGIQNILSLNLSPDNLSDDSYYKAIMRNKIFYEFKNSQNFLFLNNNIGIAKSINGNLKTINAFSLGGMNFKGFDYRGIGPLDSNIYLGGNKFFNTSVGYGSKFLFDEKDNINIKLFYTTGSIWDSDYSNNNEFELRSSLGLSFDILTAVGPISFSYAIPIEKNNEDKVKEFNFSIGSSFWYENKI